MQMLLLRSSPRSVWMLSAVEGQASSPIVVVVWSCPVGNNPIPCKIQCCMHCGAKNSSWAMPKGPLLSPHVQKVGVQHVDF